MRIISGSFKGKNIEYLKSSVTRPLKDSIKENIFNILSHSNEIKIQIQAADVLDLYSGVGSFGLECMSRGASKVTFVEKDKNALEILNKNVNNFFLQKKSEIISEKIEFISNKISSKKYKIFFLDPPFADVHFINILEMIKSLKIYKKKHIVIIHRERKSKEDLKKILKVKIEKFYGRSKIIFGEFT